MSGSGRVALRCRWQMKQGISVCSGRQMRKALAADEDAGHRNRKALGAAAPVRQWDIAVESKVAGALQSAANLKTT